MIDAKMDFLDYMLTIQVAVAHHATASPLQPLMHLTRAVPIQPASVLACQGLKADVAVVVAQDLFLC